MSYDGDEYYTPEYYDDDEYEQIKETSHSVEIYKAKNGQAFVVETYGWCYWGQDWGETVDQWEIEHRSLRECRDDFRAVTLPIVKRLKPGEKANVTDWYSWIEDEDMSDPDEPIDYPMPF